MSTIDAPPTGPTDPHEPPDPSGPGAPTGPVPRPSGAHHRDRRNRRRTLVVVTVLVAVLVVPILLVGGWLWYQLSPPSGWGDPVSVTLQSGWGTSRIADELAHQGVIGSATVFRLWERDSRFASGTYQLRRNMGVLDAASAMKKHVTPTSLPEVGVLPGLTLDQVGDRVAGIKRFSKDRFLTVVSDGSIRSRYEPASVTSLRGLLWPDSYPVPPTQTEAGLTKEMVEAFDAHGQDVGLDAAATALHRTPYEVITVASMIQREAALDEDRPLIAAVIYNRLAKGMLLQIDATTEYATQSGDPSYNTYKVKGLPPTPISIVSAASLDAAMHPADVPYLYYVLSDASGKHAFATTYQQHLQNVAAARAKGLLP